MPTILPLLPLEQSLEASLAVPDPLAPPSAPPGIPQSTAIPEKMTVAGVFGEHPWEAQERMEAEAMARWQHEATARLDQAIDNPEEFFKDDDLSWGASPDEARRAVVNNMFLTITGLDGDGVPADFLNRSLLLKQAAHEHLGGKGGESEEAFHGAILDWRKGRADKSKLLKALAEDAASSALLDVAERGKSGGWKAVREKLATTPEWATMNEADPLEAWHAKKQATRDAMAPYADELATVWQAFQKKEGVRAAARAVYDRLPDPRERMKFMASLRVLSETLPEERKQEFWANLKQQTLRDVGGFLNNAATFGTMTGLDQPTDPGVGIADAIYGTDNYEKSESGRLSARKAFREGADFAADVVRIEQTTFDPVDYFTDADSWARVAEGAAYGAPGAIGSTLVAAIPGLGLPIFYASAQESAYQNFRGRFEAAGDSTEDARYKAEMLSPFVAVPEIIIERLQIKGLAGKLPVFEKTMQAITKRFSSMPAQAAARMVGMSAAEGMTEQAQGMLPDLVQNAASALGADVPWVDWSNGKDGVFDGFWKDSAQNILTMLPLAIFGAGRGVMKDRARIEAVRQASDTQLLALGVPSPNVAEIRGAGSFQETLSAIDKGMAALAPQSDEAKSAVAEMDAMLKAQFAAAESLKASGVLPDVVVSADGFQVRDPETREIIGTAKDAAGAMKIASAHSAALDDAAADHVAYLFTSMEAAQAAVALDPQSTVSVELSKVMTEAAQAAEDPASIDRFREQQRLRELAEGGSGEVADAALGNSNTTFRELVRKTANRIFQGGSVLTVFHETAHGLRRAARAAGVLTRADDLALIRAVDAVMDGKRTRHGERGDRSLRLIPEGIADADVPEMMIDEAIAEIMEMEVMRTRAGGKKRPEGHGIPSSVNRVAPGIISRNLSALGRMKAEEIIEDSATLGKIIGKWKAFSDAVRGMFGLATQRALALRKAERDGLFDTEAYDAYLDRLTNTSAQRAHEAQAAEVAGEIVGALEVPAFSQKEAEKAIADGFTYGPVYHFGSADFDISKADPTARQGAGFYFWPKGLSAKDALGKFANAGSGGFLAEDIRGQGLDATLQELIADGLVTVAYLKDPVLEGGEAFVTTPEQIRVPETSGEILAGDTPFSLAPVKLSIPQYRESGAALKAKLLSDTGDAITNAYTGWTFGFFSDGAKHVVNQTKGEDRAILPHLKELAEQAVWLGRRPHRDADKPRGLRWQHLFYTPFQSASGLGVVRLVVNETWQGERLIDAKAATAKKMPAGFTAGGGKSLRTQIGPAGKVTVRQLSGLVKELWPDDPAKLSKPVNDRIDGSAFSLAPSAMVSRLNERAISLIRNPRERAASYQRLGRKLADLRLAFERLELVAGSKRRKASLRKEAAVREALRLDELVNEAWGRHGAILSDDDLTRLKSQPVHEHLADPNSKLRGRLMSKGRAMQQQADLFITDKGGEWDGADGISRAVFGGSLLPDQAAQELYDAHLIKEPTPDAMWDAIRREQAFVDNMKEALRKAQDDLRDAKRQAKQETNDWLKAQESNQAANFSDKQEILRALAVLDGVLSVVPADIRGKVGGYTQLAALGSNETRLEFLKRRLAMVDAEMEKWLAAQYDREFRDLLKRTRPAKEKPGEKPTGTIGADLHEVFRAVEASMGWKPAEVEAEATKLESLAASNTLTAEEEANAITQANLIRLAGNWTPKYRAVLDANGDPTGESILETPGADAARREQAVIEAARIIESGYWTNRLEAAKKRANRAAMRQRMETATGKAGTREERRQKAAEEAGLKGGSGWKPAIYDLMSFEQVLNFVFGETSDDAARMAARERWASDKKTDAIDNQTDALAQLYADLAGGGLKGSQLAWRMAQSSLTIRGETFSEMEAVQATLMWRQEDGRRHMMGHQDENGAFVGKWHYDQAFVDEIEAALSPEAKEVRLFLIERYAAEYDRLNPIYRELYGVNLPRNRFYSPLTVKPVDTRAGAEIDPVTGSTGGLTFTPGSLKNRSADAIAEPDFRDAAQTWIAHTKQLEHWMAYAGLVQDLQAVIGNRDVRNAMEAKAGKEAVHVLSKWVEYFGLGGTRDAAAHLALNGKLSQLTGRAAGVALIGRAGVLAVQSVQLGAALAEMPTGSYLKRLGKLFAGQLGWSDALNSEYIQRRVRVLPPAVRMALDGLHASKPNALKHAMAKVGTLIGAADAFFTAGTYAITLDYHRAQLAKDGVTGEALEREAHQAAQRSCDRVAQPVRPGARSFYEVSATHPMARLGWAFASEARQKLGLVIYAAANKDVAWDRKARAFAVAWLVGGAVTTLIRAAWRDMRDDDDEETFDEKNWGWKRLAFGTVTGPLKGIPVLGEAMEATAAALAKEYSPEGNLLTMIPNAAKASKRLLWDGPKDWETGIADAERLLMGLGVFSDSAAAAAQASHLIRDAFALVENLVD